MISNENIIIMNVENSEIIQQYAIRKIKKVLDKYKNIKTEELRSVEKLILPFRRFWILASWLLQFQNLALQRGVGRPWV